MNELRSEGAAARAALGDAALVIGGPTASGKSALAAALAETLGGEVINADSMQVYRDLPILTAQPDAVLRARAPHRLYGVLDLAERCSAGRWRAMASSAIAEARAVGRVPIVVGGTGLCLRALMGGLADIPDTPPALRARIAAHLAAIGAAAFHAELAARDAVIAARLRPTDRQRLIRAAEVLEHTGRSLAAWQADTRATGDATLFRTVLVNPPRAGLYAACDARFRAMVDNGALEEARRVLARDLAADLPGMKALGLRELIAHLRGEIGLEEAIKRAQGASRRYAKRQVTWFNSQFITQFVVNEQLSDRNLENTISLIIKFLLTRSF